MPKSKVRSRLSFQDELEDSPAVNYTPTKSLFDPSNVISNYTRLLPVVREELTLEHEQNLFRLFLYTYKFHGAALFWQVNDKSAYKKRFGQLLKRLQVSLLDNEGLEPLLVQKGRIIRLFKPNIAVYKALGIECGKLEKELKREAKNEAKSEAKPSKKRGLSNMEVAAKVQRLL